MPYDLKTGLPYCIALTSIYMASEALFIAATFWETGYYRSDFGPGTQIGIDYYVLDLLLVVASFALVASMFGAFVANGMWIYRAVANARALEPLPERVSPGWAVAWHIIPIANLWMPFRAIKQTWNTSTDIGRPMNAAVGHPFAVWWACWVISSLIGNGSFRLSNRAVTEDDWITVGYLDMTSSVLSIIAGYFFLQILRDITRAQDEQTGVAEVFS